MIVSTHKALWPVVEESFDEAEFLWRTWESSLDTHARNYRQVWFWTEDRLGGALDGVCMGGVQACDELLSPGIQRDDAPGTFMVSAHALAAMDTPVSWEILLPTVRDAGAGRVPGLRRALELHCGAKPAAAVESKLRGLGDAAYPWIVALRMFRKQASDPSLVQELATSLTADHRRIAMAAARLLPTNLARKLIEPGLADIDSRVVAAATESGLVHGLRSAWARCLELGVAQNSAASLFWMACLGGERERRLLMAALGQPRTFDLALQALGFLGTKDAANAALQAMQNEPHARLAAEAFCAITGLNLAAENLVAPEPPLLNQPISYELDDMNADLVPKLDDLLPLPDVQGVQRWWHANESRFFSDTRYIGGKPLSPRALLDALASGPMRRRHVLAFELAVRTEGLCDLQTRAFYVQQREQLAGIEQALSRESLAFCLEQPSRA